MQDDQTRPALLLRLPGGGAAAPSGPSTSGRDQPAPAKSPKPPPSYKSASGFRVRLIPVTSASLFMASKLTPDRNNVRWVAKKQKAAAAAAKAGGPAAEGLVLPTPLYNAGVLQDMSCVSHAAFLSAALAATPRLADGILLLKTWARQRGLLGRSDVFDGHTLTMLMVHLAKQGKLVRGAAAAENEKPHNPAAVCLPAHALAADAVLSLSCTKLSPHLSFHAP